MTGESGIKFVCFLFLLYTDIPMPRESSMKPLIIFFKLDASRVEIQSLNSKVHLPPPPPHFRHTFLDRCARCVHVFLVVFLNPISSLSKLNPRRMNPLVHSFKLCTPEGCTK